MSRALKAEQVWRLRDQLVLHEGLRLKAYKDTKGIWTIGVGHALPGITDAAAKAMQWTRNEALLTCDYDAARHWLELMDRVSWLWSLDPVRQNVFAELSFNMGAGKVLLFRQTLQSTQAQDFRAARAHLSNSKWAREDVGRSRSERILRMLETGRWPDDVPRVEAPEPGEPHRV